MWYVNVDNSVIQANVYEKFFQTSMQDDDIVINLRKDIKQYKEKSGQFIIKHKQGHPNEWVIVNISEDKEKWYLFNEDNQEYSIVHHLATPGNAWYHNSHSSSSSMYERIFEAFRTMYNNQLEIKKLDISKPHGSALLQKFNDTNSALTKRLRQNLDMLEGLGLVENPKKRYDLQSILDGTVKIFHKENDQLKENTALLNRLKRIKEYVSSKSSVPREIHSKLKKEEKAKAKQQASATAMETDQTAHQKRAKSPPRPATREGIVSSAEPTYW